MRKITSNYLFSVTQGNLKNGIIILNDDGTIADVIDNRGLLYEISNLEYYNGILVPGFINTHCHLELSYLKGKIDNPEGLTGFIAQMLEKRLIGEENAYQAAVEADNKMYLNGITGVGDISNTDVTFRLKSSSLLDYYTFIEVFDLPSRNAELIFSKGKELLCYAHQTGLKASLVPHAPYSVSTKLLEQIAENFNNSESIYSIHNQESQTENELFISGKGKLSEFLIHSGIEMSRFNPTGFSSLKSIISKIPMVGNILLVHNTFTSLDDIDVSISELKKLFWVICPNSNLIIEGRLPDLKEMCSKELNIAVGTDSYASNTDLSILSELKTISKYFPEISLDILIRWATLNGAKALNMDKKKGSFEKGKKPGVNLITGIDFDLMRLTEESKVKVLM
jgi:cytosine/adenosine deaminase-related metal-dependent hydrolase